MGPTQGFCKAEECRAAPRAPSRHGNMLWWATVNFFHAADSTSQVELPSNGTCLEHVSEWHFTKTRREVSYAIRWLSDLSWRTTEVCLYAYLETRLRQLSTSQTPATVVRTSLRRDRPRPWSADAWFASCL